MDFSLEKTVEDARGKILVFRLGSSQINMIMTKKGFSRGGHFHKTDTSHELVSGRIEYREEDPISGSGEKVEIFDAPAIISVAAGMAHIVTALEDSVMVEMFDDGYEATNYPKYRQVVDGRMSGTA